MNQGWHSFAVVEELMFFDPTYADGVDPRLVRYDKYWGPNYFIEDDEGEMKRNFFVAKLEEYATYILPLIKNIKHWI